MNINHLTALFLLTLSISGCQEVTFKEKPLPVVAVYELPKSNNQVERVFNAVARAQDLTHLSFRVGGKISNILVTNGQQVQKGDLLAVIDKQDYQVALKDRKARVQSTYNQYQRAQKMLDKKLMAQAEYDQMRAQYLVAKAQHRSAELELEYTELRAPFSGVIGEVIQDSFVNVQPGSVILNMHKIEYVEVDVQVPDSLLAVSKRKEYRTEKRKYEVVFDAYPEQVFTGETLEVNTEKDPSTRSYIVTLAVPFNSQYKVLEGMPARVKVDLNDVTYTYSREHTVPLTAVAMLDGDKLSEQIASVWVYQAESQTVTKREVTLGVITGHMIEIKAGLNDGEIIIANGVNRLIEGQKVELKKG
ncbi:efflux RND transporter periplasmic adaptor subunit [Motilimonas sp. 1_MG-2023]|uniref:efflux RND transporter periplasmic adaptor subunit n=1 Tax=Motilimonas sp. 1_MG-2023 TaxID=3062672 RepID=UPI0026E17543|nr:efflux RND transporter periplasmic adaptor subunit [Motilimonas sp. 1_MG-2023]MDO6525234.1 efflux RND transporter periplasmic adaptor subunit [Motilimonas sp. 1_MG-2023]